MTLKKDLYRIVAVQAALWAVCLATEVVSRLVLHLRDPYQFFMLHGDATFYDFSLFLPRFRSLHHFAFFAVSAYPFLYPAPASLLYAAFLPFRTHANMAYGFAMLLTFSVAAVLFCRGLIKRGMQPRTAAWLTALGALMSYPFWYCYQRGNIEVWVWAISAGGAWALLRGRPRLAAVCFGVAGAIKLYPLAWLGLLLLQRRWKALSLGLATAALLTWFSLWVIYPQVSVSAHYVLAGLAWFDFVYTHNVLIGVTGFDHSLYTLVKRFSLEGHPSRFPGWYLLLAGVSGLAVFFWRVRQQPLAQQVTAVAAATIVLPPVSFDYTLLHTYTALGALLLFAAEEKRKGRELLLLAAVCSPLTEFIYRGSTFGGQIHAMMLVAVFLLAALPLGDRACRGLKDKNHKPVEAPVA